MRLTEIHLEGRANYRAVITRRPYAKYLRVDITTPDLARAHTVRADDREDLWSMAECLQSTLEGVRGCGGDIRAYFLPLELISDV